MIKMYEALKAENERLSLANEAQNEVIQRQQEKIRSMQLLLRELFNHLGKSDELKERINEVISWATEIQREDQSRKNTFTA